MKDIIKISLVFENCECYDLPPERFLFLDCPIQECIYRCGCNMISKNTISDNISMGIFCDKNKESELYKYLTRTDITALNFYYSDNTQDYVLTNYEEDKYSNNINHYYANISNQLIYILINEDKQEQKEKVIEEKRKEYSSADIDFYRDFFDCDTVNLDKFNNPKLSFIEKIKIKWWEIKQKWNLIKNK